MKKCTLGTRHEWSWLKNVTSSQVGGKGHSLSWRGLYRCACGEKKLGNPNEAERSPLNDLVAAMAGEKQP